ncbi:MAG: DUF4445 domain-containing protein [Proteobacteria bacterium]|nr:DUF4445 domain-containing protein [Pseudomonadota bacterium]MBU1738080.1 DUF4445 domain-containing protein [Pseudomonadota bacterium]
MDAIVRFFEIHSTPPSLQDNTADLDRLRRAVGVALGGAEPAIAYGDITPLAAAYRKNGFAGVAVVNCLPGGYELVDFLSVPAGAPLGMALDLGTTHLEASLINLQDGSCLARKNLENSQIRYGDDILSRIHFAATAGGLKTLQERVVADINHLAERLAIQAEVECREIRALCVSGNTTMVHFFLNLDPHHLIREPYTPLCNSVDPIRASGLSLAVHPAAPVLVMPSVGSYFGGDLVSGIIASGMDRAEKVSMLIDVGTNAEVVIGNRDWMMACAGAAGPALEGGVARMGMRAGVGAIERLEIEVKTGELSYTTIGGGKPVGLCGSGIIDLVAALYLCRVIDIRGKFREESSSDRLVRTEEGLAYVVAGSDESADGRQVVFGQVDLDAVMRSKAAMYSILTTLASQVGVELKELEKIYVAGAFGKHIKPRQAIVLGMLPDLDIHTFVSIGNSSLAGAEKALIDRSVIGSCRELARKITYLELNVNQDFMIRFSGCRFIPHTDHTLFPSVPFFNEA